MQCTPELEHLGSDRPIEAPQPRPVVPPMRYQALRWCILGVLVIGCLVCVYFYVKLGRWVDRRLAEGPFSSSTNILAMARTIAVGEAITPAEAIQSLEQSGYTRSHDNPVGWYEERGKAIQIFPGAGTIEGGVPVRVEFAGGKISSIVALNDHSARQEYRLDPQLMTNLSENRERRRMVRFADIPTSLVQALTSVEDKHFFHHPGFDIGRVVKAAYIDIKDGSKEQGASTLTMQLARGLWLDPDKNWRRKAEELLIASHLEHKLTKQQIFEDYSNHIYLGRRGTFSINGFGEGARAFFGKDLSQIGTAEAALLAGLVRRPSYYNPFTHPDRARERRNVVLDLMLRNGYLTMQEYRQASDSPVNITPGPADESSSSYFIAVLNNEIRAKFGDDTQHNRFVYTTLDLDLQKAAEVAVRSGMENVDQQLRKRRGTGPIPAGQPQVALIALDPRTGEIKALVGGRDYGASQLNHVLSMRQPGSVFKPFVYAAAINTAVEGGSKIFTPASTITDGATTFYTAGQVYQPRNFHGSFMGDVTLRTALAHSLNVATVSLAQQVGYGKVVAMARRAGLNDGVKATPAVALGAYEATPLEIAGAYTMFVNGGSRVTPTTIAMVRSREGTVLYRHEPEVHTAIDPRVAYVMVNMMQEVLRSGTGAGVRSRGFTLPAAGKTGTSRDGWFAGFTNDLLCVVWVGFDDNRDLNLEGARSALPIWADFMKRASQLRPTGPAREFQRPPGLASAQICADSGELAGDDCPKVRPEVFIAGTEPVVQCRMHDHLPADSTAIITGVADKQ